MFVTHPLVKPKSIKLRKYQELVVSRAIGGNTLVVLPTGLGKTIIAAMVAAHRLHEFPHSKVLFLAPTKPLAVQHQKKFSEILKLGAGALLTGQVKVSEREELWRKNKVIFATPQTIENGLMRNLSLEDVSLIVFDEGHRAVGNYSYVFIAKEYMKESKNPLVLTLTASPSSDKETIKEISENLFIEQIEARTDHDRDVKPYVKKVNLRWIRVELPEEFKRVKLLVEEIFKDHLKELKKLGYLRTFDLRKVNKRTLLELQSQIRREISQGQESFQSASLVAGAIKLNHALELLETQGMAPLHSYLKKLSQQRAKAVKRLFLDERVKRLVKMVHDLSVLGIDHPKLEEVAKIVEENKNQKIIIFTQYRDSVEKIIEKLNDHDLLAHEFIGQARKEDKKGMSQKEQIKVLEKFKEGKYDALVSTAVGEEGLDIPKVDLVVFYEPVPSDIRSIQRRGRTGRTSAGKVIILMAKDTRDEGYYWASYHKEKKMRKLVEEMSDDFEGVGQQSLVNYNAGDKNHNIKIFVDIRERNSKILEILREKAKVDFRRLEVGDFILSNSVGVERKSVSDFLNSIVDKRLFTQAKELARNFPVAMMIIEGEEDLYSLRDIHPNAIRGALASLALDFGIFIIPTRDAEDTGNLLYAIAKREQDPELKDVALRGEKKPLNLEEKQRYLVESLPNVSAVLARRLLKKFKSVKEVINAPRKKLTEIEGIGKIKSKEIKKVINSKYKG